MARRRLGQHFLGGTGWRNRILGTLPHNPTDTWIEIGAGHGEMTELLAPRAQRVIAIETDERLLPALRDRVQAGWNNVEIIAGDVLALDFASLASGPFRVYGNLPYYITSPILHHLFVYAAQIASIHIVIQLEVAERIVAPPERRDYGYLSVFCRYYSKPEIVLRIPPGAFRPPPRVKSALVKLTLPGERASLGLGDDKKFLEFVQECFSHKRKTLRNNLLALATDERIHRAFAACGLRSDARAEQLTLARFAALYREMVPSAV